MVETMKDTFAALMGVNSRLHAAESWQRVKRVIPFLMLKIFKIIPPERILTLVEPKKNNLVDFFT